MAHVKLILKEDVPSLGDAGELVSVRPGYARNYLLPRGKAILATSERIRELEHHKRVIEEKLARQLKDLQAVRDRIEGQPYEVKARAGEGGRLFGSVTSQQIAELLAARGFAVDRRRVGLREPIKELGEHAVPVRLHRDLTATIRVLVTPDLEATAAESELAAAEPEPAVEREPSEESAE
jgi:large subunit ribosomal protein L9